MSDCEHGFEEWTDNTVWRVLNNTGCPSCLAEQYIDLRKLAQELLVTNGRGYSVMVDAEKYDALNAYLEVNK